MFTVMKSVHLYTFNELSETAKDAAAQWKCETCFRDDFGEYVDMRLEDLFPGSKPQPLYDFGCTQGSGFDIVGTFDIVDLLKVAGYDPDDATEWVLNPWRDAYRRTRTDHYTYCKWPYETSNISDYLYMETFSRYTYDDAAEKICSAMHDLCKDLFQAGWDQMDFYHDPEAYSDELFKADGSIYGRAWHVIGDEAAN